MLERNMAIKYIESTSRRLETNYAIQDDDYDEMIAHMERDRDHLPITDI